MTPFPKTNSSLKPLLHSQASPSLLQTNPPNPHEKPKPEEKEVNRRKEEEVWKTPLVAEKTRSKANDPGDGQRVVKRKKKLTRCGGGM